MASGPGRARIQWAASVDAKDGFVAATLPATTDDVRFSKALKFFYASRVRLVRRTAGLWALGRFGNAG